MSTVNLNRDEIKRIQEVLKKFPDAFTVTIQTQGENGIGQIVTMTIDTEVNGVRGSFTSIITDVDKW